MVGLLPLVVGGYGQLGGRLDVGDLTGGQAALVLFDVRAIGNERLPTAPEGAYLEFVVATGITMESAREIGPLDAAGPEALLA
jgi:hypothetical protein